MTTVIHQAYDPCVDELKQEMVIQSQLIRSLLAKLVELLPPSEQVPDSPDDQTPRINREDETPQRTEQSNTSATPTASRTKMIAGGFIGEVKPHEDQITSKQTNPRPTYANRLSPSTQTVITFTGRPKHIKVPGESTPKQEARIRNRYQERRR
jgi:hypothetical protein